MNIKLRFTDSEIPNPWIASLASAVAFTIGALLPLVAILVPPAGSRIAVAFVNVAVS